MDIASLIIGVLGVFISLGGFTTAIWQIRRTRAAAESAERAATAAREAAFHVTSISDLSQIVIQLEQVKELHRNREWVRAIDRYILLRRLITEARARLPETTRGALTTAIIRLMQMEKAANQALTRGEQTPVAHLNNELVDLQQSLDEVRVAIEKRLLDTGGTVAI